MSLQECEICGEKVRRVYECEVCGLIFCSECGSTKDKVCVDCSNIGEDDEEEKTLFTI